RWTRALGCEPPRTRRTGPRGTPGRRAVRSRRACGYAPGRCFARGRDARPGDGEPHCRTATVLIRTIAAWAASIVRTTPARGGVPARPTAGDIAVRCAAKPGRPPCER